MPKYLGDPARGRMYYRVWLRGADIGVLAEATGYSKQTILKHIDAYLRVRAYPRLSDNFHRRRKVEGTARALARLEES